MTNQATPRCPNCFAAGLNTQCTHCGWRPGQGNPPPALALGVVLDGRYRIGRVLGHGGFGITYLAWDDNLHLRLAIKEYLPRDSATRAPDGTSLSVFSGAAEEQFAYGLDRFLEEARTLARFDQHPGIVTVKNYFRAHGTGYCVMEYVEGITLRRYLEQQPGGRISVDDALKLLMPVADALKAVHKDGLLHRDLAPDNIYLTQDGRVKLLDFGAARFAAGEHSKSLSVILKPGYAPEEQYRARGKQGPWTDVYGLGATLYRAITGQVPPDSLDRLDRDELVPPSKLGVAIKPEQEFFLLKMLAVKAEQRYQDIAAFQQKWRKENVDHSQPEIDRHETVSGSATSQTPLKAVEAPQAKAGKGIKLGLLLPVVAGLLIVVVVVSVLEKDGTDTSITSGGTVQVEMKAPLAQVDTGPTYEEGVAAYEGGNYEHALAIFRHLAESENAPSENYLGLMYQEGRGVTKDDAEAIRWYRKAAEQGFAPAQSNLGWMYKEGRGVAKDDAEAVRWFRKASDQGYANAQNELGWMYKEGRGVVQDDVEAVRWYRKAAEQGFAPAQSELGWMYKEGRGVVQDDAEAVRWCRKAAEQGLDTAQIGLGWMYKEGRGVVQDDAEAVRWYRKAAEQGNAAAQNELGFSYQGGRGVAKDDAEAVRWFRKAGDQGNANAQNNLGWMYIEGRGVTKDDAEAVRWFRKAAEQGNAFAQKGLGWMYLQGHGVVNDDAEAVRWFRKAAEQGNAAAQNELGFMYQEGRGVTNDDAEAVRWYRKAAEQGFAPAQSNLGWMYKEGRGVAKDDAEAVRWYRKAAEQNNAPAQSNLGWMYNEGHGVTKDYAEAVRWYRKAAEQGDDTGQFNLGMMYEYGEGVRKDIKEAKRLYLKSAQQGNADAKAALKRLGK